MFRGVHVPKTNTSSEVISRQEVIQWINSTLNFQHRRIEDLASGRNMLLKLTFITLLGAAYCLLMDILFTGSLPIRKVKLEAKLEHEMLNNYKMLQNAFRKCGIEKDIPIMNLLKGRFQDHLLFSQWFKRFYDANVVKPNNIKSASGDVVIHQKNGGLIDQNITKPSGEMKCSKNANAPSFKLSPINAETITHQTCPMKKVHITPELIGLRSELNKFKEEYEEDQQTIMDLTRERQFYYDKLCNIEVLCNEYQNSEYSSLVSKFQEILFKEEDGFQSPSNDEWMCPNKD